MTSAWNEPVAHGPLAFARLSDNQTRMSLWLMDRKNGSTILGTASLRLGPVP